MKLCKCGCGKEVHKEGNIYINGHWIKGRKHSEKTIKKMMGKIPWNKNKKDCFLEDSINKMSISAIKKFKDRPDLRKKCGYNKLTYKRLKDKYKFFCDVEEIKEDENNNVLVKCKICEEFFMPTYTQLQERIRYIKNPQKNIHQYFYCSKECKKQCKYYNRHEDIDNYDLKKLKEYSNIVYFESERTIRINKDKIKNIHLRGNKHGYSIDHKFSIVEGFRNNIDPLIISHWKNLEIVKDIENWTKNAKCSITLEELLNLVKE